MADGGGEDVFVPQRIEDIGQMGVAGVEVGRAGVEIEGDEVGETLSQETGGGAGAEGVEAGGAELTDGVMVKFERVGGVVGVGGDAVDGA